MQNILVTGVSGFIGFHLSLYLLQLGFNVIGIDNENSSYDVFLKRTRRNILEMSSKNFLFIPGDISDLNLLDRVFKLHQIDCVCNLAAEAGVRNSLLTPNVYIHSNLVGFSVLLEQCAKYKIKKFIYASSSSVYSDNGKNTKMGVEIDTSHPKSFYAATKKANEIIAYSYSYNYNIQTVGLRFFSVYGPWGRPDMLYFKLLQCLYSNQPIFIYGDGSAQRDFTYIDDIVYGIYKSMIEDSLEQYEIFNLGSEKPITINELVSFIEKLTGKSFFIQYGLANKIDSLFTFSDSSKSIDKLGRKATTSLSAGLKKFVDRYKSFYNLR